MFLRAMCLFLLAICLFAAIVVPLILSPPAATAQVGIPYSSSVAASGGSPPYTYVIAGGALPPGLTLNISTGAITGIPNQPGTFPFTAQVTDAQFAGSSMPARKQQRGNGLAAPPAATVSTPFTITVSPSAFAASGAPIPTWALLAMAMGLAFTGAYRLRRAL